MKLDTRQIAGFLRDPGTCRMLLLHGEDEGLIRERSRTALRAVAGSADDPFLTAELMREGWPRIPAEMSALSMIGGRRVVVVRDATDAVLPVVMEAMKGPGTALLILEAAGLGKGKLRSLAESRPDAACIACYPEEGRALTEGIRSVFAEQSVSAEPDVIEWLANILGGDRGIMRSEVEKLALLVEPGGHVELDEARSCIGGGGYAGEDSAMAASLGDIVGADTGIELAMMDGVTGVAVIRSCLGHLQKLHQARLRLEAGMTATEAVRTIRPPVYFKTVSPMTQALAAWRSDALLRAIEEARCVELECKKTGSRPDLLVRHFVQNLARRGRQQTGRAA